MVPAYKLPPNADHVTIMRALVADTSRLLASKLADDAEACETLKKKGGLHDPPTSMREDRHWVLSHTTVE